MHLSPGLFGRFPGWMGFRGAVELPRAALEGGNHAAHRLVKQHLDDALQYSRAKFEIDKELDPAAARRPLENPVIVQVFEWPLGIGYVNPVRRAQRHARG